MISLRTERLILRPLRLDDVRRLVRITNDRSLVRFLRRARLPYSPEDAWKLVRRASRPGLPVFAIDDGRLIGLIGLRGEFGFYLAKEARGRGYATEAGRAVVALAFQRTNLRKLEARVFHDNMASRRTLTKLGFREHGRAGVYSRGRNAVVPAIKFRIDRRDWGSHLRNPPDGPERAFRPRLNRVS